MQSWTQTCSSSMQENLQKSGSSQLSRRPGQLHSGDIQPCLLFSQHGNIYQAKATASRQPPYRVACIRRRDRNSRADPLVSDAREVPDHEAPVVTSFLTGQHLPYLLPTGWHVPRGGSSMQVFSAKGGVCQAEGTAVQTCSSPMRERSQTMRRLSAPQEARMVSCLGLQPIWNTSSGWWSKVCRGLRRFRRSCSATWNRQHKHMSSSA